MTKPSIPSTPALWARFRFSVVGSLLSAPPARGELQAALESLAAKTWTHPVTGREVCFAAKTIERWLYRARQEQDDPVGVLRRAVRKDCGKVSLKPDLLECLANQYHDYPHWTYQLHYDNLQALVKAKELLGPLQSYSTVRRYMVAQGMVRKPRLKPKQRPGELRAAQPFVRRVARGVSPGSKAASASERRHDLPRRRAVRDPGPLSSLPGRGGALSALEPQPGGSGGPPRGDNPGAPLSLGPHRQCRWSASGPRSTAG